MITRQPHFGGASSTNYLRRRQAIRINQRRRSRAEALRKSGSSHFDRGKGLGQCSAQATELTGHSGSANTPVFELLRPDSARSTTKSPLRVVIRDQTRIGI
jgi:hypothetical protein